MPILRIFSDESLGQQLWIETLRELSAALPAEPINASFYFLDYGDGEVQLLYGSPDRHHAEVKQITRGGVVRESFDRFAPATQRFLELARMIMEA